MAFDFSVCAHRLEHRNLRIVCLVPVTYVDVYLTEQLAVRPLGASDRSGASSGGTEGGYGSRLAW